jgi:hypothetical protein
MLHLKPRLHACTALLRDVINAGGTGGLAWHVHAQRAHTRWQPTLQLIEAFLRQVPAQSDHLLLIGGSAGWMMPPSWLARFRRIDAYDIDPLAPWLFNWRHGHRLQDLGVAVHHHRQDALLALPDLLKEHPNACLWFDNVLGQHRFRLRDAARAEHELQQLKSTLTGRSWGSLHDVWSGPTDGRLLPAGLNIWSHHVAAKQGLEAAFAQKLVASVGAKEVWQDHLTTQVFAPETQTSWMPWAFKPNYWHWLQAGWVCDLR